MDSLVNEADFKLLKQDKYTFAVLARILRSEYECALVLTNHKNLILCHSGKPYPVWIWTPDGASEAEKKSAWLLANAHRPLEKGYRYNLKQELAEYFIAQAALRGMNVSVLMQLFAYDCPSPVIPEKQADGAAHCCGQEDIEKAAALLPLFYEEIGEEAPSPEHCLEKAKEYIGQNAFWFWRDAAGKTVACCSYRLNEGLASLVNEGLAYLKENAYSVQFHPEAAGASGQPP